MLHNCLLDCSIPFVPEAILPTILGTLASLAVFILMYYLCRSAIIIEDEERNEIDTWKYR